MKTLKRIGLFLWLKLTEIFTVKVVLVILGAIIFIVIMALIVVFVPYILVGGLILGCIYLIYEASKDWLKDNWREVKRRIP